MNTIERQLMHGITNSMLAADPWGDPKHFARRTAFAKIAGWTIACVVSFVLAAGVIYK